MDTFDCLFTRRSIRSFTQEPVSQEDLDAILRAAMAAPTAGNAQTWRFVVITERGLLDKIPAIHPYAGMAAKAPLAVLVCGDLSCEKYPGFWVQDGSAAIQNILLASRALGIGSVWTGIHPIAEREKAFSELFGLPAHVLPLGLVVLGHTDQPFALRETFDPAKIHANTW